MQASKCEQADIAIRIDGGDSPQSVFAEFFGGRAKPPTAQTALRRYLTALRTAFDGLAKSVRELACSASDDDVELLRSAKKLNDQLVKRLRENAKHKEAAIQNISKLVTARK